MKKEYLILIALILILGAYLLLHKENRDNYTLPEIKKIDTSGITGIILDKKEGRVVLAKKDGKWVVAKKEYPADSSLVEDIIDTLKTFKLSALVSQKDDLKRYKLDDENRILVKVMKDKDTLFEFKIGKTAPSFNHTFVMLANDKNIYYANKSFRNDFDKTLEDFRDKKVLEFKEESINEFTVEKDGLSKTLISKEEKKDKKQTSVTWSFKDGTSADKKMISNLMSSVSFLECEKYLDSSAKKELEKEKPLCIIRLKGKEKLELKLFKTGKEGILRGISSTNKYAFVLSQYNGKEIVSNIEKLLGITRKKDNKD
ncbi:MAG: DUF4340 domain-containing protein [Deltaproteobacteria bacterium]|nr:DUF4340 domain-containing protein [Deltaproteobacteria bacterium]